MPAGFFLLAALLPLNADFAFTPANWAVELAAQSEPLSEERFFYGTLQAEGLSEAQADTYRLRYLTWMDELESELAVISGLSEKAEAILFFLHDRYFNAYRHDQTLVSQLFENGAYNCVSSALLYMAAAKYFSLSMLGVATHDHAFCALSLPDGERIDIEPTSRWGFDPGRKQEFNDEFGNLTGFVYTPPGNYNDRSYIGEKESIALVLQNLLSFAQKEGDYRRALELSIDNHALLADVQSRELFEKSVYNYAVIFQRQNHYRQGLDFLLSYYRFAGRFTPEMQSVYDNTLIAEINRLVGRKDFQQVETILSDEKELSLASDDNLEQLYLYLGQSRLAEVDFSRLSFAEGRQLLMRYQEEKYLDENTIRQTLLHIYSLEVEKLAREQKIREAVALISDETIPAMLAGERALHRIRQQLNTQLRVDYHNRFAELFNSQNYQQAWQVIDAGLSEFPDDNRLLADRNYLQQAAPRANR